MRNIQITPFALELTTLLEKYKESDTIFEEVAGCTTGLAIGSKMAKKEFLATISKLWDLILELKAEQEKNAS